MILVGATKIDHQLGSVAIENSTPSPSLLGEPDSRATTPASKLDSQAAGYEI